MRSIRPLALPLVMLSLGLVSLGSIGCAFKPHPEGGTGGGTQEPDNRGTGGFVISYDGPAYVADAAREYVSAVDGGGVDIIVTADANCGNQPFTVIAPPPDLLIVLDRSGSMANDAMDKGCGNGGCGMLSKWYQVTTAINEVVAKTETSINWGLKFFGSGSSNSCEVADGAAVAPAPMNAMAIATAIAAPANQPATRTPTASAELSAGKYLQTLTDTNPKFVLLATDGAPNCGVGAANTATADGPGAEAAVTTVKGQGFPTFVIGISTSADTETTLNNMATNGGYPRVGMTPQYYPVTTSAELVAALGAIQTITMGMCTYPLGKPADNADVTKVTVTVDGTIATQDASDGWHFDPGMKSITFGGSTCDKLKAGTLKNVQVLYGCKVDVPS